MKGKQVENKGKFDRAKMKTDLQRAFRNSIANHTEGEYGDALK